MSVVIVLGGHRCGTSSVAGVIDRLGLPAALPGDGIGASPSNPRGHFEDATLCRIHERLLGRGGWRNPLPLIDVPESAQRKYDAHLQRRASASERWCVKDPRLCFLLPFLMTRLQALAMPHCIVSVLRRPESAAESLRRRQRMPRDAALRIAWMYEGARRAQLACLRARDDVPVLALEYDALIADPGVGVRQIAGFLGLGATNAALDFLDPGLRHC